MLRAQEIVLGQTPETPIEAINRAGRLLVEAGYVDESYIEGMQKRDANFSTAIGNFIAIPHGEKEYKASIKKTGLCVITYPDGIDWNGTPVKIVIGIAAEGDGHLEILENIVEVLDTEEDVAALLANSKEEIIGKFVGDN